MRLVYGFLAFRNSKTLPQVIDAIGLEHEYEAKHISEYLSIKLPHGEWTKDEFLEAWPYWHVNALSDQYREYIATCLSSLDFYSLSTKKLEIMEAWSRFMRDVDVESLLEFLVYLWEKTDMTKFVIEQIDNLNRENFDNRIGRTHNIEELVSACTVKSDEFNLKLTLFFVRSQAYYFNPGQRHCVIREIAFKTCMEAIEKKISDKEWSALAGSKRKRDEDE